jgi:hypothetical protein
MDRLQTCIGSLRALTRQEDPSRREIVEKVINEFLREDVGGTVLASLERIGKAIDTEANKNVLGEDWTIMRNYVRCVVKGWAKSARHILMKGRLDQKFCWVPDQRGLLVQMSK